MEDIVVEAPLLALGSATLQPQASRTLAWPMAYFGLEIGDWRVNGGARVHTPSTTQILQECRSIRQSVTHASQSSLAGRGSHCLASFSAVPAGPSGESGGST